MAKEPFDLRLHLLDRQVIDPEGGMVCKVDDVEFRRADDGSYYVSALLSGPLALGPRLPGLLGTWVLALAHRLSRTENPRPRRIPFSRVVDIGSSVTVDRGRDQLDIAPLEDWVREHVISRIPGNRHESE